MLIMKLEGITGESKEVNHPGWSDIVEMGFQITNPVNVIRPRGPVKKEDWKQGVGHLSDFQVRKRYDSASVPLLNAFKANDKISKVEIHDLATFGGARVPFLVYVLYDVTITSLTVGFETSAEQPPAEDLTLHCGKMEVEFMPGSKKAFDEGKLVAQLTLESATA